MDATRPTGKDNAGRSQSQPSVFPSVVLTVEWGPAIQEVLDVKWWQDSIIALDRNGILWVTGANRSAAQRVVSLQQAFGTELSRPISIVVTEEGLAVWDVEKGTLFLPDENAVDHVAERFQMNTTDLILGGVAAREPPRMHGRLVVQGPMLYLETRRADQQAHGSSVDAKLVRYSRIGGDTLLQFAAPSQAELRGGVWLCCRRSPIFSPQPWWAPLSDGNFVFTDGIEPQLQLYSDRGQLLRTVRWASQGRGGSINATEFVDYLQRGIRARFAHESPGRLRELQREVKERAHRFPGAYSRTAPAITQLIVDDDDRLWVRRFDRTRWPEGLGTTWDVFDAKLRYLGYIDLPMLDYVFQVRRDRMLGTRIIHGALQRIAVVSIDFPLRSSAEVNTEVP